MVPRLLRPTVSTVLLTLTPLALLLSITACTDGQILDPDKSASLNPAQGEVAPEVDEVAPAAAPIPYDYLVEQKFNTSDLKWQKTDLTWCVERGTPDLTDAEVESSLRAAWAEWERVSVLSFHHTYQCDDADFVVRFERGDHGDGYPFDGPGNVLAHAFFPRHGVIHFDDDEEWTTGTRRDSSGAKDLQTVALHEFGHSLGLRHTDVESAVMYAYYGGSLRTLRSDDILGVRSIYGNPGDDAKPEDDHGNSQRDATETKPGTTDGNIEVGGDVDFFAFDAQRSGMWTIGTAGSTDTVCTLFDASGDPIAENDDAPGTRNCRIDMELEARRYFVRVRHYYPDRTGAYVLSLSSPLPAEPEPEPEPNPPAEPNCPVGDPCNPVAVEAFPFTDTRDTRSATSDTFDRYSCAPDTNESGGEFVYRVDLDEAGALNVAVDDVSGDGIDVDVHLLDALDPEACIARHNSQLREELEPGRYYVVVDTWVSQSGTAYPGRYTLTLTFRPASSNLVADHADGFDEPSVIEADVTLEASIDPAGDSDIFMFTAPVSGTHVIATDGDLDTSCQLFDANLNVEAESVPGVGCVLEMDLSAGSTHVLRVRARDPEATGSYTLTLQPATGSGPLDSDHDGVADEDDLCSDTPRGALVWGPGPWVGCAEGQTLD